MEARRKYKFFGALSRVDCWIFTTQLHLSSPTDVRTSGVPKTQTVT